MQDLLFVVAPIFIIMGVGWLVARLGHFPDQAQRAVTDFCFRFAMPSLLFLGGMQGAGAAEGKTALAFFGAAVPLFGVGVLIGVRLLRQPLPQASMFGLNMSFGNTAMMGVPVIFAAFGQAGLSQLLTIIALHSIVLLPIATMLAEFGLNARAPLGRILRATGQSLLRNPIVMAVVVAQIWSLLHLPVPAVAERTLTMMGAAGPPAAIFCLGASLASFSPRGAGLEVGLAAIGKLAFLPLAVFGLGTLIQLEPLPMAVAVVSAALPTGANAFILARRYEVGAERSGATVLVTSAIAVVTLSIVIGLMRPA
ncbi:AEC family transporter [Acetobacteraceae bacterium H6797]|nr:AEC family transporter [Acetobacteraceae bacterium H6797]